MESQKSRRPRSKVLVVLLLPVLIFLGVVGWCIYTVSNPKRKKQKPGHQNDDPVTFLPIDFEEQYQIRADE